MDLQVVKAEAKHLLAIESREPIKAPPENALRHVCEYEHAYAYLDGKQVVAAAGVVDRHRGSGMAWAFLDKRATLRQLAKLTRMLRAWLNDSPYHRVEVTVHADFIAAQDWTEKLGFQLEGFMRKYGADGADHFLYGYVK